MSCYYCGKGIMFGRSHTHHRGVAGGRWKKRAPKTQRIFKPNLQPTSIMEDGEMKQVKLCGKCIKRVKKDVSEGKKPKINIAIFTKKAAAKKTDAKKADEKKVKS